MKCIWCYIANPDLKPHGKFWNWAGQLLEFFHPKEWEPYIICWCTHTLHELWLANSLSFILHFARRESCSQILTTRLYICCCHVCWWIWLNRNVLQMWTCSSSCVQILGGGGKNSPTVLSRLWDQSSPNSGGVYGIPCRLTSFFLIVDIVFRCRYFGQSSKSVPKNVFCPQPVE